MLGCASGNEAFDLDALAGCEIVALPEHPAGGVDLHVVNRLLGREHNTLPILVNSDRAEDIQAAAVELIAVVGKQHAVFALVFNGMKPSSMNSSSAEYGISNSSTPLL